jgi:hypothetical protein
VPGVTRPINADVPEAKPTDATKGAGEATPKPPPPPKRRRRPIPGALKAIGGLFLLAVVFLVAAIVGGGGSGGGEEIETPAPVSEAPGAPAEAPVERAPEELGYPAFATANTTRVGGADPASTAAAVALAVYPAAKPAQRPDAVALVDAADWRGGIAAAALMAPPLGAPLLISENGELPEPSARALTALSPSGEGRLRGTQVVAVGDAAPTGLETRNVGGDVAGGAALAALRERLTGRAPQHFVVAPTARSAFAMPAAAWAARSGDAVLFAGRDSLPAPTAATLREHPNAPVYVLGPSSAISSDVIRRIGEISRQVRRVSGESPVENALALARYSRGSFGWNVNDPGHGFVVARSSEPLAAAAAAPLSASGTWGPLLLTGSADTLPQAVRGYLLDVKPGYTDDPTRAFYNHVWVIGDQEAIDVNQQAEIDELAALARIGGKE